MMSTISQKCPAFESTKKLITNLFTAYDLEVTVLDRKVLSVSKDKAMVQERLRVKKIVGNNTFKDHESFTQSQLIYDETGWKLCKTEVLDITYLNASK